MTEVSMLTQFISAALGIVAPLSGVGWLLLRG
jgi:hypothetical protein